MLNAGAGMRRRGASTATPKIGASLAALRVIEERARELGHRLSLFQDEAGELIRRNLSDDRVKLVGDLIVMSSRFHGVVCEILNDVTEAERGESDGMFQLHRADEVESILDRVEIFSFMVEDVSFDD